VVVEPAAQLPSFVEVVANLRDDQVRDLDVGLPSIPNLLYRLENRLRVRYPDILSDKVRFSTAFEINSYAVEKIVHHRNRVRSIEPIRDEYVDEPVPARLDSDVMGELHEYSRLVVSVRNSLTTMAQRQAHHLRRHEISSLHLPPLTNVKVLAITYSEKVCQVGMVLFNFHVVNEPAVALATDRLDRD